MASVFKGTFSAMSWISNKFAHVLYAVGSQCAGVCLCADEWVKWVNYCADKIHFSTVENNKMISMYVAEGLSSKYDK